MDRLEQLIRHAEGLPQTDLEPFRWNLKYNMERAIIDDKQTVVINGLIESDEIEDLFQAQNLIHYYTPKTPSDEFIARCKIM